MQKGLFYPIYWLYLSTCKAAYNLYIYRDIYNPIFCTHDYKGLYQTWIIYCSYPRWLTGISWICWRFWGSFFSMASSKSWLFLAMMVDYHHWFRCWNMGCNHACTVMGILKFLHTKKKLVYVSDIFYFSPVFSSSYPSIAGSKVLGPR